MRSRLAIIAFALAGLPSLATEAMREKIEVCSYKTGEYLTKKGFPPLH